jgi:hypothetical protein
MKVPSLAHLILLFFLGGVFLHFLLAAARTFYWKDSNGTAAALVLVLSVAVYEWARHTIWGRDSESHTASTFPRNCAPTVHIASSATRFT